MLWAALIHNITTTTYLAEQNTQRSLTTSARFVMPTDGMTVSLTKEVEMATSNNNGTVSVHAVSLRPVVYSRKYLRVFASCVGMLLNYTLLFHSVGNASHVFSTKAFWSHLMVYVISFEGERDLYRLHPFQRAALSHRSQNSTH